MELFKNVWNFVATNWVAITAVAVAVHTAARGIRDAIDKTPATDDNLFERTVTIMGKAVDYIVKAKRPENK